MFIWIDNGNYITPINKKLIMFFLYLDNTDDFRLILKTIWIPKTIFKITAFEGFSGFSILKVIFKSNSLPINKKINHINIKRSLFNKILHFVKTEIFSIKL